MSVNRINCAGVSVAAGEKYQGMVSVPGTALKIPLTIVNGVNAGNTLLISAGLHSGEYPGVAAVIELARKLDPKHLNGSIILLHCINTSGFFRRTDAVVAEDGVNLNAAFPGDAAGTPGQRIAAWLAAELLPRTQFIVDLHSGGTYEPLMPCLFFPASSGGRVRDAALGASRAMTISHLIASFASSGLYSHAATQLGIPGLLLERGGAGGCASEQVLAYLLDMELLMVHLGHLQPARAPHPPAVIHTLYNRTTYLTSPANGLWYPEISPGDNISKGALIGELRDFFGNLIQAFHAEHGGTVFYHAGSLAISAGVNLAAYGESAPSFQA